MALAIRLDHLIKSGQVTDQAELARVGHVSRARLTQIMDLNLLAPEIQEELLFWVGSDSWVNSTREREARQIVKFLDWQTQRQIWQLLKSALP